MHLFNIMPAKIYQRAHATLRCMGGLLTLLTLFKFRLEELAVIEPLAVEHIAIDVIMKDADLPVILRIEHECFIVIKGVMFQCFSNDSR